MLVDQAPGTSAAGEGTGGGGGNGALIGLGVVLLLGAAGGILYWVTRAPEPPKVSVTPPPTATTSEPTIELPSIDPIPDTGVDTGPEDTGADAGKKIAVAGGGCPAVCSGTITPAVKEAVAARAGTAKQCYKTALEGNEGLAGDMSVLVRVGADGSA
ncbi:MAG: hypothetical protein ABI175_30710, partial [Polyangiales bacterium]